MEYINITGGDLGKSNFKPRKLTSLYNDKEHFEKEFNLNLENILLNFEPYDKEEPLKVFDQSDLIVDFINVVEGKPVSSSSSVKKKNTQYDMDIDEPKVHKPNAMDAGHKVSGPKPAPSPYPNLNPVR